MGDRQVLLISPSGTSLGVVCTISNAIDIVPKVSDMINMFVDSINNMLTVVSCSDFVSPSDVEQMIENVKVVDSDYQLILPDRFHCPHHGFAL